MTVVHLLSASGFIGP